MPAIIFRSRFTMVLCVIMWGALAVVMTIVVVTPGGLVHIFIPMGLTAVAAIVWVVLWSPHIRIDDDAVTIANVFREIQIPWAALIDVDTRFSLTLRTPRRAYSATAAPAPGQLSGLGAARAYRSRTIPSGAMIRPGDLPSTDSGQAAELVRDRWHRLRDSGRIEAGKADITPVLISLRISAIVTVFAAVAMLVTSSMLG